MIDGASAILELIDAAPAFVEPAPLSDADRRQIGLEELSRERELVRAAEGELRDEVLRAAAERLGQLVAAGCLEEAFARATLQDAAGACGLGRDRGARAVTSAINAALKAGRKHPRDLQQTRRAAPPTTSRPRPAADRTSSFSEAEISEPPASSAPPGAALDAAAVAAPAPPAEGGETASSQTGASASIAAEGGQGGDSEPPDATDDDDAFDMRLAFFPLTDLGNAERFRERYRDRLLFCAAIGWLAWDGRRWGREGAAELVQIAEHHTVRAIQREARVVRDSGVKGVDRGGRDFVVDAKKGVMYSDRIAQWGRSSESSNKLGALSKQGAPYFAVTIDKLDADPMRINVANGTLRIDRAAGKSDRDCVSFADHDPKDLITKLANVEYLPEADCPIYDGFIAKIQPGEQMRRFLHQWGGLSLTGDVSEQKLAFLYGKGRNGKSTLVDVWGVVAGDYGETVPIETFLDQGKARGAGQATPDLAILPGVRMLRTSEPEKNSRLAESLIKLMTGGEPIQARHLNRDFFKFYPQFKLTMSGNYRPQIAGTDEGIWRRMRLVPFAVQIAKEEIDPHLGDKLRREASGILNRLLDGLRDWCDKGLIEPEEVTKATAAYREDSDPMGRFLAACVVAKPGGRVQSSVMHAVFCAWCKANGEKEWSNRGFSMALKERGYVSAQSNVVWWHDVDMIKTASDFVDADGRARTMKDENDDGGRAEAGDMSF